MKGINSFYISEKTLRSLIDHWLEDMIRFEVIPLPDDEYLVYSYEELQTLASKVKEE